MNRHMATKGFQVQDQLSALRNPSVPQTRKAGHPHQPLFFQSHSCAKTFPSFLQLSPDLRGWAFPQYSPEERYPSPMPRPNPFPPGAPTSPWKLTASRKPLAHKSER